MLLNFCSWIMYIRLSFEPSILGSFCMGFETDVKNIMKSCMKKWEMFILSWGFRCKQGFAFKLSNSLKVYHEISEQFFTKFVGYT